MLHAQERDLGCAGKKSIPTGFKKAATFLKDEYRFFFNETLLQHRHTTYNTIACTTTYNAKTNTTHNYLHYNCKTTHTHNTRTHSWARNRVL